VAVHGLLGGFSDSCSVTRQRKSALIMPGNLLMIDRIEGTASNVLNRILTWVSGREGPDQASDAPVDLVELHCTVIELKSV
jgi:hypothetical protein